MTTPRTTTGTHHGTVRSAVAGAVGVLPMHASTADAALAAGVWVRPFRNLIYTMPPFVIDDADLSTLTAGIGAATRASLAATRPSGDSCRPSGVSCRPSGVEVPA